MKHAALFLFAFAFGCGGNVVVDHGSGGAGQGGHGNGGAGGMSSTLSVPPTTTTTNVTTTASTGGSCKACWQVLGGADAAQICGGSDSDAYNGLLGCVCGGGSVCPGPMRRELLHPPGGEHLVRGVHVRGLRRRLRPVRRRERVSSAVVVGSTGSGIAA